MSPSTSQDRRVHRIFHPSDFSEASRIAFAHALKIALVARSELISRRIATDNRKNSSLARHVEKPPSKKHTFGEASWSSSQAASQDRLGRCALTNRIRHGRVTRQHRIPIAKRVVDQLAVEAWPNAPNGAFFGRDLPLGLRCVKSVVGGFFGTCRNPNVQPKEVTPIANGGHRQPQRVLPARHAGPGAAHLSVVRACVPGQPLGRDPRTLTGASR